jgi:hypothetical protein
MSLGPSRTRLYHKQVCPVQDFDLTDIVDDRGTLLLHQLVLKQLWASHYVATTGK